MRRSIVAVSLVFVFILVIGDWQLLQPVHTAEADAPTVTPTETTSPTSTVTATITQDTAPQSPTASPTTTDTPVPENTATPTIAGPMSVSIYLPLVLKQPTPIETATSTPCAGSVQVVQNPSFESASTYWTLEASAAVSAVEYTDGTHSVSLGGYDHSTDAVSQTIAVPPWATSGAIYASWWMFSSDDPTNNYDELQINLLDPNSTAPTPTPVTQYLVWNTASQQTWTDIRQDIPNVSQFAGSVLTVQIAGLTDQNLPTFWYVDNVRVVFACGPTVADRTDPTATPTPTAGTR